MLPTTYKLSVLSNGAVYAESNELQFSTWCSNTNSDWPYEQIECNILAQLKQSEEIAIRVMNIKDNLSVFKVCINRSRTNNMRLKHEYVLWCLFCSLNSSSASISKEMNGTLYGKRYRQ